MTSVQKYGQASAMPSWNKIWRTSLQEIHQYAIQVTWSLFEKDSSSWKHIIFMRAHHYHRITSLAWWPLSKQNHLLQWSRREPWKATLMVHCSSIHLFLSQICVDNTVGMAIRILLCSELQLPIPLSLFCREEFQIVGILDTMSI